MNWKIYLFLCLSLALSIFGFIFPTHQVSVYFTSKYIVCDTYIGERFDWLLGFYILIPWESTEEITYYFNSNLIDLNIQNHIVILSTFLLYVVSYVVVRNVKNGKRYYMSPIYIIAFILLIASQYYEFSKALMPERVSIWGFIYCGYLAILGNRELNFFYGNKKNVNARKKRIFFAVLKVLSIVFRVFLISFIIFFIIRDSTYSFSQETFIFFMPSMMLLLITIPYEIFSLIRARINKKSIMRKMEIVK